MIRPTGRKLVVYDDNEVPLAMKKRFDNGDLLVVRINDDYSTYNWSLLRDSEGGRQEVAANPSVQTVTHAEIGAAAFHNRARTVD
jgi:hypothetical protein